MAGRLHYAWVVLLLTFLALLSAQGVRLAFGAFIPSWEAEFATDRGTLSLIAMISFIVYGLSQPLVGKLVDRWGIRWILALSVLLVGICSGLSFMATQVWHLLLLYGVIASVGFGGASGVAASVAVVNWFNDKRGLALGTITAGTAAGQLVLVPGSLLLIDRFGWQAAVLLLGILLTLVVFPLRTYPREKGVAPLGGCGEEKAAAPGGEPGEVQRSFLTVVTQPAWWCLAIPYFICGFTTTGLMDTHLVPFAHDHGYTTVVTGTAVSLLAGFNILGTLLSGHIADRWSSRHFLALLYGMRAVSILLLVAMEQPAWLLVFAVLFGLVDFATVAPTSVLAARCFSRHVVSVILGWHYFCHQLGSALGAYLSGVLFTWTESYAGAFWLAVTLLIVASFMSYALPEVRYDRATGKPAA